MDKLVQSDVIVVGAGISGLLAAGFLRRAGHAVLVLDKGRGVGGRLSRRRTDTNVFDHGAQYFTAHEPHFRTLVQGWLDAGIIREWCQGIPASDGTVEGKGDSHYCGIDGMNSLPKFLARELEIRTAMRVVQVRHQDGRWLVTAETGDLFTGRALLLTAPVPQSLELFRAGGVSLDATIKQELEKITYDPCLALMATLSGRSRIPEPGALRLPGEPILWMADNTIKGVSSNPDSAVTIHAGPKFSQSHWDTPEREVTEVLLSAADSWLGRSPVRTQLHRWRYSQAVVLHPDRCVTTLLPAPLAFAGDGFGLARIEGAALSGLAAGEALGRMIHSPAP